MQVAGSLDWILKKISGITLSLISNRSKSLFWTTLQLFLIRPKFGHLLYYDAMH